MTKAEIKRITAKIRSSRKYRSIYGKTVERIVVDAGQKYLAKEVEKEARNLLHRIWASYFQIRPDFKKLLEIFRTNTSTKNGGGRTSSILRLQSSTRERIPFLDEFYRKIFAVTGSPQSIVDWGCGLNPLSWPWMNLPANCRYLGLDIDRDQIDFLNAIFKIASKSNFQARLADVFIDQAPEADIVFLLKLLPLLEHQQKGSSLEILKKQKAKWLVVSFPTKSLGGKHKNMVDFYTRQFQDLVRNEPWQITRILFPTELVFVVKK